MLARGIDIPTIDLVINFDVPIIGRFKEKGSQGDADNYLHRTGRAGRFGIPGMAITLYDHDDDETYFNQIVNELNCEDKVKEISGIDELKEHCNEMQKKIAL